MEIEVTAEAKDKRLNRLVAITVVVLSVATGLCNIKDGNIVQAMQQAQSNSVDLWNEYQATKTKLHLAEASRAQIAALAADPRAAAPVLRRLDMDIAKYTAEAPRLAEQAKAQAALYDAFNIHDDQFDAGDAAIATAISIAAVSACWRLRGCSVASGYSWGCAALPAGGFIPMCSARSWDKGRR